MEGVAIWIDNMFLRVAFRLPGSSGSVTRAQILSAGHSPTKAPAVLKVNVGATNLVLFGVSFHFPKLTAERSSWLHFRRLLSQTIRKLTWDEKVDNLRIWVLLTVYHIHL